MARTHTSHVSFRGEMWWERWLEETGRPVPDKLRKNKRMRQNKRRNGGRLRSDPTDLE